MTTNTVLPLPKRSDSVMGPLAAKLNKGLMIHWINADLLNRMGHDVRKSVVFYDEHQTFETALTQAEWNALGDKQEQFLAMFYAKTNHPDYKGTPIRYYSKGIK